MKNNNHTLVKAWLEKADKDIIACEVLLKKNKRLLDYSCFHLQQAFEKYLKAFLVSKGIFPEKTHSLEKLIEQSMNHHLGFIKWVDAARTISPFAIIPRYPDEILDIDLKTVRKLIKKTKLLGDFIKELTF